MNKSPSLNAQRSCSGAKREMESLTLSSDPSPILQAEKVRPGRRDKEGVSFKSLLTKWGQYESAWILQPNHFVIQPHPSLEILQTYCVTAWLQVLLTDSAWLLLIYTLLAAITTCSRKGHTQVKTHPLQKLYVIRTPMSWSLLNSYAHISTIVVCTGMPLCTCA